MTAALRRFMVSSLSSSAVLVAVVAGEQLRMYCSRPCITTCREVDNIIKVTCAVSCVYKARGCYPHLVQVDAVVGRAGGLQGGGHREHILQLHLNIRDSQRQLEPVRDSQSQLEIVRDSQSQLETIRTSQRQLETVRASQSQSETVRDSQRQSETVRDSQRQLEPVRDR